METTSPHDGSTLTAESAGRPREGYGLFLMIIIGTIALLAIAILRHYSFRSGAMDLGFFDQCVYLISKGLPPISSYQNFGFHILGDHVAFILYPIALLYTIHPSPLWLLFVQSFALSLGAWPVYKLSRYYRLTHRQALAMALIYLLHPYVLTTNLFDFHPDALAAPGLMAAIYFALTGRPIAFGLSLVFVLSCKELYGFFVAAMGVWLLLVRERRTYGAVALVAGLAWFIICIKVLVPHFGSNRVAGMRFFDQYGTTMPEVAKNMILNPGMMIGTLKSKETIKYLLIVFGPIIWALNWRYLLPLVATLPILAINVLGNDPNLRDPKMYYTLPAVPFFLAAMIMAVSFGKSWLTSPKAITIWACGLIVVGAVYRVTRVQTGFAMAGGRQANFEAIELVRNDPRSLLTTFENCPHVSHRTKIQRIDLFDMRYDPLDYDFILINMNQQTMAQDENKAKAEALLARIRDSGKYTTRLEKDGVYLLEQAGAR